MKKRIIEAVKYWESQRELLGSEAVDKKISEIKAIQVYAPWTN